MPWESEKEYLKDVKESKKIDLHVRGKQTHLEAIAQIFAELGKFAKEGSAEVVKDMVDSLNQISSSGPAIESFNTMLDYINSKLDAEQIGMATGLIEALGNEKLVDWLTEAVRWIRIFNGDLLTLIASLGRLPNLFKDIAEFLEPLTTEELEQIAPGWGKEVEERKKRRREYWDYLFDYYEGEDDW